MNLGFPDDKIFTKEDFEDIAFVEVKKLDEGKRRSSDPEIKDFAQKDKDFLRKQIELINPHIILCCNTQETGYDIIYDDLEYEEISKRVEKCICRKYGNRLVIDFWHPSEWYRGPDRLFEVICEIVKDGDVFKKFTW